MKGLSLINFGFAKKMTKMEKIEPYIWFHALFIGSGRIPRTVRKPGNFTSL